MPSSDNVLAGVGISALVGASLAAGGAAGYYAATATYALATPGTQVGNAVLAGLFSGVPAASLTGAGLCGIYGVAHHCYESSREARRRRIAALPLRQMPVGISNPMAAQPSADLTRVESWDRRYRRV